ncbi:hypothetical protein N8652_01445 [bacterium]|nr:hypothetical protein [bacterium]
MHHALWDSATNDGDGPFDQPDDIDRFQNIGGLLLTFDQFKINVGDRVYGYEISAADNGPRTGLDLFPFWGGFSERVAYKCSSLRRAEP